MNSIFDKPLWPAAGLFALALLVAGLCAPRPEWAPLLPLDTRLHRLPAEFSQASLPPTGAPDGISLAQLPDGRIAAAWSATSSDAPGERSIWYSTLTPDGWQKPHTVADRASTAAGTFVHAGSPGSPQLFAEGGWLHLWYPSRDGITGDSLNHSLSTDAGRTWRKAEKIRMAPLTAGSLQIMPAHSLSDGGLQLPFQQEGFGKHVEILRLSATGKIIGKQPQPVEAEPFFPGERAIASLRLSTASLLAISRSNDSSASMHFWHSDSAGRQWRKLQIPDTVLSRLDGRKAPALLFTRDGRIHLAAVGKDGLIHHHVFTEAWLNEERP